MGHMFKLFELMYERAQPNGVYLIDDTHACF
jgi:hypothetical protein